MVGPSPVNLCTAGNYAILAETGVSTVPSSAIMAISPIVSTALTGFPLTLDGTGTISTSTQVNGKLYAASYSSPTPSVLGTAIADVVTAYSDAAGRVNPNHTDLSAGAIGGVTLTSGLYKWNSAVNITSSITMSGGATDTWIFQIAGTLNIANAVSMLLSGGALARNIVWVIADNVTAQAGAHVEGIILAKIAVTLVTGATVNGRILGQTAVALQQATVVAPA